MTEKGPAPHPVFPPAGPETSHRKVLRHLEEGGARAPMLSVLLVPMRPSYPHCSSAGETSSSAGSLEKHQKWGRAECPVGGCGEKGMGGSCPDTAGRAGRWGR